MLKTTPQNKEQRPDSDKFPIIMSNDKLKTLGELSTAKGSAFANLTREAARRTTLSEHIRSRLLETADRDLAAGISQCNIRNDGILTILATSPEWTARLRFETELLLSLAREREPGVASVKIRTSF